MKNQTFIGRLLGTSILALSVFTACQTQPHSEPVATQQALVAPMQNFKALVSKLLPILIDQNQFNAPENRAAIEKDVKDLYEVSKQVVHNPSTDHMDPSIRFISTAFSEDLRRAQEGLELGKRDFARYELMNMTAYCIECHTRTNSGPSFNSPALEKSLSSLTPMGRGEYLLATRQFDPAFVEFEKVIKGLVSKDANLFELDRAVRYALSISVKYQLNPKKSQNVVDMVEKSEKSPFYLRQNAHAWSASIREWKSEGAAPKGAVNILHHADNLVKLGHKAQMGIVDRGGDIYFLRALSELNSLLQLDLSKENLGQALFLTGTAYEAVRDLSIWSLHENYFESCIRQVPHSVWSEKCYSKLEESIYLGYTGTSGVQLPADVQTKLSELQKIAFPETK